MFSKQDMQRAYTRACRLLEQRPRSTEEVCARLLDAGFSSNVVQETISTLTRCGLLDDEAFAMAWRENRCTFNPRSKLLIRKELTDKGIAPDTALRATEDIDDDEVAIVLAQRRAVSMRNLDRTKFLRRMSRYLYTRGFSHATVVRTLSRLKSGEDGS